MKLSKNKKNAGFSLIEIMVGIVIIIAATTVVLSIIISSFRISSKTTTDATLRQNGNYALTQMSRIIQFADTFVGASVDGFAGSYVAADSCSSINYHYLELVYNEENIVLSCTTNGDIQVGAGESSLDNDSNNINVGRCNFTCTPSAEGGPLIGIDFSLSSGGTGDVVENRSSMDFSTSVKMRNP